MQRYHHAGSSCNSAINNNAITGVQARNKPRADSSTAHPNFSINSRRSSQLTPYKLKCDKEQLNSRLGPPDFHPQSPNCLEESLNKEYVQSGYRETVEGLEESREISLSQFQAFPKPIIVKNKEAIRKCHRAIDESRAKKRKAGQVYGVPLSGALLTKPGIFPEQRSFGEEFRKKWIEGLSQPYKRLRSLSDHVPHGYRKKSLFEVLIRNNIPLLRATWFIKVTYLNQIRTTSSNTLSSQLSRSEQWTKDVIEYLQYLLDEFITRNNPQMVHKKGASFKSVIKDEEHSLYTKWWYMLRIINWHQAEGLIAPSLIIDWVLNQLQDKELFGVLQLLLPIIFGVIEKLVLSQTYVCNLVKIALRFIEDPSTPGGSDLVDNSRHAYTTSAVVEMIRYLLRSVPDTFVALDCFPLPPSIVNDRNFLSKIDRKMKSGDQMEEVQSSIQKRAQILLGAATPNHNVANALHLLDQSLVHGDIAVAYRGVFENFWGGAISQKWIAGVAPCLLVHSSMLNSSLICPIFFICEWATCEFRDFRNLPPRGSKFTGRKDFSQIFIATRLLKLRMKNSKDFPSPLQDAIVCWIDQHEVHNGEGFKRVHLLIREFIQSGVFSPQAYVRQLIVSEMVDANVPINDPERRNRHYKMLKQLPAPYVYSNEPLVNMEGAMHAYSNERRLVLEGLLGHSANNSGKNRKHRSKINSGRDIKLDELKASISLLFQLPVSSFSDSKTDVDEETTECEECRRVKKRQKLGESNSAREEGLWWVRKGLKNVESFTSAPHPTKQPSRGGRQKSVRKTQSLAQLAITRIEGSQGASTSHVCESTVSCPHHRPSFDDVAKSGDIVSIGKIVKGLQFFEKRAIAVWLVSVAKERIEESEMTTMAIWSLGEDELSTILYLMDICNELLSGLRFLFWLLPKVASSSASNIHARNILDVPRMTENHACQIGEAFLLSSIRRYENTIVAADLIPETLSAMMHRTASILSSNGRISGSPSLLYTRHLLTKYNEVPAVIEWVKSFKPTCDKRIISELESVKSLEFGVPTGVEDPDDYFRRKISGVRISRVGLNMKEIAQRIVNESSNYFYGKDNRKWGSDAGCNKIAQKIVIGLLDCMRQTGGAAQEGDPSLVSSAIAAIVNNVGQSIARIPDLSNNVNINTPSNLHAARRLLRVHITCLCILKEALGERQSRVFEVALSTETSSALLQAFPPGKAHDFDSNIAKETSNRITASVFGLVIGALLHGVSTLERMVTLFKLKEGLNLIQFKRGLKSNLNGNARSKVDNSIEVSVNWFRVLVGNCRTICDGFLVQLLGEASIMALSRMQRTLPLNLVVPPAYSVFSFVVWKPILEEFRFPYQSMVVAITDAITHTPFREICLRDTHGLHALMEADNNTLGPEFVSMLESSTSDISFVKTLVPIRSRLFLDALIDCKIPQNMVKIDDSSNRENVKKLLTSKLVHVLDTLQPARFHWQWVELRLLIDEQCVNEKLENDIPLIEAISPHKNTAAASESESHFVQIVLTRLLVRPDAGPLFSKVVRLLGKSLEDSMLSQAKWLMRGWEVLYGKKSIRQKVRNIAAEIKEQSLKPQYWKPWGWCSHSDPKGGKRKSEAGEGGESVTDVEGFIVSQQHMTERAFIELILPCVDQGSDELRFNFTSEMVKQMSHIEQQINTVAHGGGAVGAAAPPPGGKSGNRKTGKNGIHTGIIAKGGNGSADTVPPAPAALRASMTLRLQFLIRLLPVICADRDPSPRNMRSSLASVILRLLGSRVVHEDACVFVNPSSKRDLEAIIDISSPSVLLSGENLFDCFLLVLQVLMSSHHPSWLKKLKSESKSGEYAIFDREVAESLQNDLNQMELPETIRWRIQTAMPILFPSPRCSTSYHHHPSITPSSLSIFQTSIPVTTLTTHNNSSNPSHRILRNVKTKNTQHELDIEIDPWNILEDGAGSADHANLKSANYLKGAVRVRRTDLTYIGTIDEDS